MAKTVTVTQVKKSIRTALAALGTTPNQIAASLKRRKITGVVLDEADCVLAKYIGKKCPHAYDVKVNGTSTAGHVDFTVNAENYRMNVAKRFTDFISAFDSNKYPDLVAA